MIEIFKTNVEFDHEATRLVNMLSAQLKEHTINFDLEDCDRILRIENAYGTIAVAMIQNTLKREGYYCEVLD